MQTMAWCAAAQAGLRRCLSVQEGIDEPPEISTRNAVIPGPQRALEEAVIATLVTRLRETARHLRPPDHLVMLSYRLKPPSLARAHHVLLSRILP